MEKKKLEELTLIDNFMFGAVMQNPKLCKPLLELILNIKIAKIEYPQLETTMKHTYDAKGVRLDVYVEDEANTVYNIEMQASKVKGLPKRMRYYQGMIDLNILEAGMPYNMLKKSYIIFICNYDEFGYGRSIYTFENKCKEIPELVFGDETVKIVLNTTNVAETNPELKGLMDVINGKAPTTEYGKELEREISKVKENEEWRREYMTLFMRDNENKWLGELKKTVSLIRGNYNKGKNVSSYAEILCLSEDYVEQVIALIEEHPDWDDESIASELL